MEARHGGSPTRTPNLVGFGPHLSCFFPEQKEGGEKEKEGGATPSTPCPIRFGQGEARATLWPFFPLSTKAH